MKIIASTTDPHVVLEFLKAELNSERFSHVLKDALSSEETEETIISSPNLTDLTQNMQRELVLGRYRGWKRNQFIFHNFPSDVHWYEIELTQNDISALLYINYSYWIKLSNGSKKVGDAAMTIAMGKEVMEQSNQRFLEVANEIRANKQFPKIILVSDSLEGDLTILEGHLRATAYALAETPKTIKALLGTSSGISTWVKNNFG